MELELTDERLIDFGLNLLGYVSAVSFSLVVYSIFFGRKLKKLALQGNSYQSNSTVSEPQAESSPELAPSDLSKEGHVLANRHTDLEYFSLGEADPTGPINERFDAEQPAEPKSAASQNFSRNRSEVIRLARKMLEAGNSAERVSDLLPITESEMRLVALGAGQSATGAFKH